MSGKFFLSRFPNSMRIVSQLFIGVSQTQFKSEISIVFRGERSVRPHTPLLSVWRSQVLATDNSEIYGGCALCSLVLCLYHRKLLKKTSQ